jgi:hypothetical protein
MEHNMKKLGIGSLTLAVVLSVVPIILMDGVSNANELLGPSSALRQTSGIDIPPGMFRALHGMSIEEHAGITPMTDDQLASIEGGRRGRRGGGHFSLNIAVVVSNNICVLCSGVSQSIITTIGQSNSSRRR